MRTEARTEVAKRLPLNRVVVFIAISAAGLWWDLFSKWWVFSALGYEHRSTPSWFVWLWGQNVFRLMTSFNHGALFGMGQGLTWLFALLSVAAAVFVICWLFAFGAARSWWLLVALSLVFAGTLGNLYDRLGLHGLRSNDTGLIEYAVRDFMYIEVINWPIFNFADTYLVTGACMLLLQSLWAEVAAKTQPAAEEKAQAATGSTELKASAA